MQDGTLSLQHIIDQVSREKGIDAKILVETMEQAILTAAKRTFGPNRELEARYNSGLPFPEIPERRRPKAGPSGWARQAHALRVRATPDREDVRAGPGVSDAEPEDCANEPAHELSREMRWT